MHLYKSQNCATTCSFLDTQTLLVNLKRIFLGSIRECGVRECGRGAGGGIIISPCASLSHTAQAPVVLAKDRGNG